MGQAIQNCCHQDNIVPVTAAPVVLRARQWLCSKLGLAFISTAKQPAPPTYVPTRSSEGRLRPRV